MSAEIATILGLAVMFIVATALPINMGALGFGHRCAPIWSE